MKETIEKIRNNKALKIIGNILYVILFLIIVLMLVVVVLQRTSNNSIALGGFRLFNVATGSMVPKYEVGDVLIAKEIKPEELKVGDDVVYQGKEGNFQGKIVTHQIIAIEKNNENYEITTKGIANDIEDPQIDQTQIYGKIVYKVQTLSMLGKMMKNIYVFYFIVFVPIVVIVFKQIYNLVKSYQEDKEDDDDEDNNGNDDNEDENKNN